MEVKQGEKRCLKEAQHGAAEGGSDGEMEQYPSVPFEHGMLLRPHAKAPPQARLQNRARGEPSKPGLET